MYLCICQAVTVVEVRKLIEAGIRDFDELVDRFSLGGDDNCGTCHTVLENLLVETHPVLRTSGQETCGTGCQQSPQRLACAGTATQGGME